MTEIVVYQLQVQDLNVPESVCLRNIGTVTSKTKKPLNDLEIIWDLCNFTCWGWNTDTGEECRVADYEETETKQPPTEAVTKGVFKYSFTEYTPGYCNDDICCKLETDQQYHAASSIGWRTFKTLEEAENHLKKESESYAGRFYRGEK